MLPSNHRTETIRPIDLVERVLNVGKLPPELGTCVPNLHHAAPVDLEGIAMWILVGTVLFGPKLTTLAEVKRHAAGAVAVLAMARARGNLTRASKSLKVSRRCLRETLKAADRYPWSTASIDLYEAE